MSDVISTRSVRRIGAGAFTLVAVWGAAGCGGAAGDKAGGVSAPKHVTLTLANPTATPEEFVPFAAAVARLSHGSVRIAFRNAWRATSPSEPAATRGTLEDVRRGRVDLAAVPTRSFDTVGVHAFDALQTPLLVDSYALEQRILAGPLASRMLAGARLHGVVAVGLVPGPLRKPLGVSRLVVPADYAGKTIAISSSPIAEQTLRVLGARSRPIRRGGSIAGTGGIEQQVASIEGNAYDQVAGYLTANVNLWPRPNALVVGDRALQRLTAAQRHAVSDAAAASVGASVAQQRRDEHDSVAILCRRGLAFVAASARQLAALRAATAPIGARLGRSDALTGTVIGQVQRLKTAQPNAPDAPSCGRSSGGRPGATARTAIDGTYRVHTTAADLRRAGAADDEIVPDNYGDTTMVLNRGRFIQHQPLGAAHGSYTVHGNLFVMTVDAAGGGAAKNRPGEQFTFRWSLYRDLLTFRAVAGKVSPTGMLAKPWRRVR
jgi:TRAP-type C4-dicarboxylate transport system substrate-binding protein